MALSIRKAEDWAPHEAEIRSLYIDQNWTLGKTRKHMELKYGFKATVKQYKRRFNDNKNIKTPEWILIGKVVQKRAREGKRTDVLLHQRLVDPQRVARELARRKLQIDRAKTPVNGDDQAHSRTSFHTPAPSPGPSDVPRPLTEDDGDNILWDTYVALSPADSTCSVSHILSRVNSDQDMDEVISELSVPSPAPTEIDYGDLNQLDIEFWIDNLPITQLQKYLREQGPTFSSIQPYPLFADHHVIRSISHSWSEDSLKGLIFKGSPRLFDVAFPAGVPYRKSPNALEIALFAMTNNLFGDNVFYRSIHLRIQILIWLIEPAHLSLIDSFRKAQSQEFSAFALSFIRFSSDLLLYLHNDENQKRLLGIMQTLVVSRLPSNFLTSAESSRLLCAVAGYDCFNFIRSLIDNGACAGLDICKVGPDWFPLFIAAKYRRLDTLRYLVNQGVDINTKDTSLPLLGDPWTALGYALRSDASSWDVDSSKGEPMSLALLKYGADINSPAFVCDATALEWASFNAPHIYDRFIQHDPTIKAVASVISLIGRAAHDGPRAILQHSYSSQDLEQALVLAVQTGSIPVARALLQANINPNCASVLNTPFERLFPRSKIYLPKYMRYEDLHIPLRAAIYGCNEELVGLLLKFGANFSTKEMDILWGRLGSASTPLKIPTRLLQMVAHSCDRKLLGDLLLLATYYADRKFLTTISEKRESEDSVLNSPRELLPLGKRGHESGLYTTFLVSTPLQVALVRGNAKLAQWLWNSGFRFSTPPDYRQPLGQYELKLACECLEPDPLMCELVDIFLDHGAIPNSPLIDDSILQDLFRWRIRNPTDTCLHSILGDVSPELIPSILSMSKKLIDSGADLTAIHIIRIETASTQRLGIMSINYSFGTAVQKACSYGLTDVVKLLIDAGADIHAAAWREGGRTALQAACGSMIPSLDLIHRLLDQQCYVNSPPAETRGVTALQAAAACGYVQIAIKLLSAGADVNAPAGKIQGKTAIEAAAEHGRLDMVKLLINAGALGDTEAEDRFHEAIRLAEVRGHKHIVDLLVEHQ